VGRKRAWSPPRISWEECCRRVAAAAEAKASAGKRTGVSDAALQYAAIGLSMLAGSREQRVQAMYIKGNLGSWFRDEEARAAVKAWAKVPPEWRPMPNVVLGAASPEDAKWLKGFHERQSN